MRQSVPYRHYTFYYHVTAYKVIFHAPDLNSRVHVIVDIIVFQHTMAIVIEVHPNLSK